jgi:peptide/nickel transport system permease protein
VVGAQLRKNRSAMVALALVRGIVWVAILAPLLSFSVPIVWIDDGRLRLPLLSSLFDRRLFENGVEIFFNVLLLAAPAWWLAGRLGRSLARRSRRWPLWGALLAVVLVAEALAAVDGRADLRTAVGFVVVPGVALRALASMDVGARLRLTRGRTLLVSALLVGAASALFLASEPESSAHRVWRGAGAEVGGMTLFPPIPFHPNGVGDPETLSRARTGPSAEHWLGCDLGGRDVVSRLVFGTRISITIGFVGVSIYVLIGTILGSLAGYYLGRVDLTVSRLVEVMICFPTFFLILTIIALWGRSIFLIMAAIGVVGWPGVTRLVRGEFLRQRNLDYVTAARAQGVTERRIMFRHLLPNCLGPVIVASSFGIASAILTESSLAFLGLGDQLAISWGDLLSKGRDSGEWHLILAPGAAIFFVVTVFNLLGEGLRDALDPKLRR